MPSPLTPPFAGLKRRPLYLQAKAEILKTIESGLWKPGTAIPSEAKLSADFGIAIGTLRRAVQELVDEGVLLRRQGFGTFVKSYAESGVWNRFQRFQSADGRILRFSNILLTFETVPAPEAVAESLGISEKTPVLHIRRMLSESGMPRGVDELYLRTDVFTGLTADDMKQVEGSLYRFYEASLGVVITDVLDSIEALVADAAVTARTGIETGAPYFRITRIGKTFGRHPVEYRIENCLATGIRIITE